MSAIRLTKVHGGPIVIFTAHIVFIEQKDNGTCFLGLPAGGTHLLHVKESEAEILRLIECL